MRRASHAAVECAPSNRLASDQFVAYAPASPSVRSAKAPSQDTAWETQACVPAGRSRRSPDKRACALGLCYETLAELRLEATSCAGSWRASAFRTAAASASMLNGFSR